jgi:murein DD-endopeptidase MepM/ murein hydrolase activator NlpD
MVRRARKFRGCITPIVVILIGITAVAVRYPATRQPAFLVRLFFSSAPDSLPHPVEGVRKRQIANSWGAARSNGRRHQGVDIFAQRGTPVRSTTDGIVLRVGTNTLGGRIVTVMGPGRQVHYYAHLDRYGAFNPGDVIRQGDVLGYVGNTGNATGTPFHLHYGVYDPVRGALNPWPLLHD